MKTIIPFIFCLLALTAYKSYAQNQTYSFVVMGDDRVRPEDKGQPQNMVNGDTATINVNSLKRIFSEVGALTPAPKYLFVNGDLVYGYNDGTHTGDLEHELKDFITLYKNSGLKEKGVQLVAIPGNHEFTDKKHVSKTGDEKVFEQVMADYIPAPNVPELTSASPDGLSYSFNFNDDHFVILKVDTLGNTTDGNDERNWLKNDINVNKQARHIFVLGHEPLHISQSLMAVGMDTTNYLESLWRVINNRADIYFGSHIHVWDSICPPKGNSTWELICGNAGMKPDKFWKDPYFGYTVVTVNADSIKVTSMGYNIDANKYDEDFKDSLTTVKNSFTIRAGNR